MLPGSYPTLAGAMRALFRRSTGSGNDLPQVSVEVSPLFRKVALHVIDCIRASAKHGAETGPSTAALFLSSIRSAPTTRASSRVSGSVQAFHAFKAGGKRRTSLEVMLPAQTRKAYGKFFSTRPGGGGDNPKGGNVDPFFVSAGLDFMMVNIDFMKRTWAKMSPEQRMKLLHSVSVVVYGTGCSAAAWFYKVYNKKVLSKAKELIAASGAKADSSPTVKADPTRLVYLETLVITQGRMIKALQRSCIEMKLSAELGLYRFPIGHRYGRMLKMAEEEDNEKKDSAAEGN